MNIVEHILDTIFLKPLDKEEEKFVFNCSDRGPHGR